MNYSPNKIVYWVGPASKHISLGYIICCMKTYKDVNLTIQWIDHTGYYTFSKNVDRERMRTCLRAYPRKNYLELYELLAE